MNVPFLDLGRLHASIRRELDAAIDRVLSSSAFVGGAEVASFEEAFGAAHGAGPAASCGSGTDALELALRAAGLQPGGEVIVPAMTFVATAEAVLWAGGVPVVADVDPTSLLLTPEGVDAVRTDRTAAVVPVHLYGHAVPTGHLRAWRDEGLIVVEDAAQAHLAHDAGDPVGTAGHAACFSFFPGKNLGALGDGGAVTSTDDQLLDAVRRLRDHGRTSKYVHDVPGRCSRLDGLQAAVLAVKLRHLPGWTERRRSIARRYAERLDPGMLVPWREGAVHHLLVARSANREIVRERLAEAGIGTGIHYPVPLSRQPWMASGPGAPAAETAAAEIVSLPMDPLMSEGEVDVVVEAVSAAVQH
jgi:dTDP-4-amino-4,6-dideoxygalactose transaminase